MSDQLYRCIVTDPPWPEEGGGGRGAQNHYDVIRDRKDILNVMAQVLGLGPLWLPMKTKCRVADSAHLWMWTTDNYLEDALWLIRELDFRYLRTFAWVKTKEVGDLAASLSEETTVHDALSPLLYKGLGQYARGSHELCLLATRGDARVPGPACRPPSVLFAPRAAHSAKPTECFTEWFEQVSLSPRLELFSRRQRQGWDAWGNDPRISNTAETGFQRKRKPGAIPN